MSKFDEQLSRMRALCTYGTVNEDKKQSNYTLEYHATAADGKEYGIIKECSRFYIKSTTPDKKTIAESYQYIGGWANKKDYEYESYNNALKNFELKLESINEAHDSKVSVETLDPFKKELLVVEGTENMKNEIARQRQIMYNAAMLMNESTDYAVKCDNEKACPACSTKQPEAETGAKGDKAEGSKEAKADPNYKGSHISLDKKAAPFEENPKGINEVASPTEGDFDEGAKPFGTTQNGEADTEHNNAPFTDSVNEETNDWASEGLPSSAGVGEADTDHNNDPFNKSVNEADEDDAEDVESDVPADGDDEDFDLDALMDDEDAVADDEDAISDDEDAIADDEDALADDEEDLSDDEELVADDETEFPSVGDGDELGAMGEDDDIMSKIADLEAQLAALKAEVNGDEDMATDTDLDAGVEDVEDDFDGDLAGEDFEGEDDFDEDEMGEDDFDEMYESKKKVMNRIVESVVKQMLSEDELHDFGKHPGYRKKPMDLPPTGQDKNEHGEDINDDSVHNEEPFGKQIGDGSPFNQLVDAVTKDVMYQLKKGVPIEGENKKKE